MCRRLCVVYESRFCESYSIIGSTKEEAVNTYDREEFLVSAFSRANAREEPSSFELDSERTWCVEETRNYDDVVRDKKV